MHADVKRVKPNFGWWDADVDAVCCKQSNAKMLWCIMGSSNWNKFCINTPSLQAKLRQCSQRAESKQPRAGTLCYWPRSLDYHTAPFHARLAWFAWFPLGNATNLCWFHGNWSWSMRIPTGEDRGRRGRCLPLFVPLFALEGWEVPSLRLTHPTNAENDELELEMVKDNQS